MEKVTPIVAAANGKNPPTRQNSVNRCGRGIPEVTKLYLKKCSCDREKTIVFCRSCGYYCPGRIRIKCEKHPRVSFLFDITECPRCHSAAFLDEYYTNV